MTDLERILRKMTVAERVDYLKANADSTTEMQITRPFDEDEMREMRDNYRSSQGKLEELKDKMKAEKIVSKGLLAHIVKGSIESNEEVFWMYNSGTQMMDCLDCYGDLQKSRKLKPEEKQTLIPFTLKTGTHGE